MMTGAMTIDGKSYLFEIEELKTRYKVWAKQAGHCFPCLDGVTVKKRKDMTICEIIREALNK